MSYELRVGLQGLYGLVPNRRAGRLSVLLVDARSGGTAGDGKTRLQAHVPCVQFPLQEGWTLAGCRPHYEFKSGDKTYGLMLLNRTELQFKGTFIDSPLTIQATAPSGEQIVCLEAVSSEPGVADVDPACLSRTPPPIVAARLTLTAGTLSPDIPSGMKAIDFRFGPLKSTPPGADKPLVKRVAPASRWQAKVTGSLELTGLDIDDGSRQWTLSGDGSRDLEISIKNMEWSSILSRSEPSPGPDIDFHLLYEISQRPPAERPIPFPEDATPGYGGDHGLCMPAFFKDVGEP